MYTTRPGNYVRMPERYTRDLIVFDLTKTEFGYHLNICSQALDDIDKIEGEVILASAGLGGDFEHKSELKVMKYDEAMKTKDRKKWEIPV